MVFITCGQFASNEHDICRQHLVQFGSQVLVSEADWILALWIGTDWHGCCIVVVAPSFSSSLTSFCDHLDSGLVSTRSSAAGRIWSVLNGLFSGWSQNITAICANCGQMILGTTDRKGSLGLLLRWSKTSTYTASIVSISEYVSTCMFLGLQIHMILGVLTTHDKK